MCNCIPCHTLAVKHWRMCPYIVFDFAVIGDISLTRIHQFYRYCERTTQFTQNEQLAHQFHRHSSTPPPKKAASDQLRLAGTRSSMGNLRSPLSRVASIVTGSFSMLQEDEIYDESDRHDNENNAAREDDLRDGLGDNLSDGLGNNPSKPEPTRSSEIAAMRMKMEQQRDNQLHTLNGGKFKYRQLHWASIVEVYTITVPIMVSVNSGRKSREIKIRYTRPQSYLPRSDTIS